MIERMADHAGLVRRCCEHGADAVDQHRRDARAAAEIAHDQRHPVEIDGRDDEGVFVLIDRGDRIGGDDGRLVRCPAEQIVAQHKAAGLLHLLEIGTVAEIDADQAVQGRALHPAVAADDRHAADPGQVDGQAGAQDQAALADAAGRGADIGGGFQHRLDRRDHFALRIGAVLGELANSWDAAAICLARVSSSERTRSSIKGPTRISASNASRARIPRSCLEFHAVAVETDARHRWSPAPAHKVRIRVQEAFPGFAKIRTILKVCNRRMT